MSAVNAVEGADFRGPLDVTRAATAVLDAEGIIVGWGPAAQALLGYPPHEAVGHPIGSFVVDRPGAYQAPTDLPGASRARRQVLHMRHRDGRIVRVTSATLTLFPTGAEGPARLLAVADAEETERWEALQAMLRGLATQSPVGLAIYDTERRVVWTNHALYQEMGTSQYAGLGPDDMVTDGEVLSVGYPPTLDETMRQVLGTGEPVIELHYRGRPPVDPERDHVWSCSYYRLQSPDGSTLGVCEETVDITERYLAQQRLDLLVRAGARVGTTLDMVRTAQELSAVTVPQFADAVTIDLIDTVLEGDQPAPGTEPARSMVRVWDESFNGGPPGTAPPDDPRAPGPPKPVDYAPGSAQARCLVSGRPVLERFPETDGIAGRPRANSRLSVPLRTEGVSLGVVTFTRDRHPDPFGAGDLPVADELVARAAICVDNARRYTREHTAALVLQRSLLPRNLPSLTGVEIAHRYLPADNRAGVGGDWFDVIALPGTRVGMVVGDVVGHGLRAAATMGRLRTSVRVLAALDLAPDELLSRLDDLTAQGAHEQQDGNSLDERDTPDAAVGVTCLYAVYDPVTGRCVMARAGHPPPAVVDPATGTVRYPDLPAGQPIGFGGLPFESAELTLPEGSLLALFTDGLIEGRGRDRDAELDALRTVLADHRRPLEELCDQAVATMLPGPVDDDAALLLVRTRVLDRDEVAVWDLEADPEGVSRARALAAGQVRAWGLDEELVFTTEVVVSELVTNAIRYASGPIQLRLIRDRTLICEVSDTGHTSPHLRRAAIDDEGGRGLFLIAQMTQQWGTRYTPTGKTIWAEQPLP
ncbi:SpoIIE family protein phosphatase [Streptomyces sp. SP18CS02]|uniref:SpoIIE family protein phosphatase n=1 Tax=Streptomyces sp. SP18CS02 TaxID=3002531 RepID=UPI002E793CA7|nr:SpoIIE family protein phosphatase [Streptomyces sp. SP18CS02]MEE1754686.1 SpoIIE family protein phosphatase [Streptomyces sp. SP18CS02]